MNLKINKIILVSIFFLAILTLGAVSASQDINETGVVFDTDDQITIENPDINENQASEDILAVEEYQKLDEGRKYAHDELYNDVDFDKQFSGEYFWHQYDYEDSPRFTAAFESDGLMNGVISLYFDDEEMTSINFIEGQTRYYMDYDYEFHGDFGTHTWKLQYSDDDYYDDFTRNGTYEIVWAKVPEIVEPGKSGCDFIDLKLYDSSKFAVLELKNENDTITKQSNYGTTISLSDLKPGVYNYTLTHPNHRTCTGTLTVLLGMFIKTQSPFYAFGEYQYTLSDSIDVNVEFSDNVNGNIDVAYNNKTYTFDVKNGKSVISVENKILGFNNLVATFNGDEKYSPTTREKRIYTIWFADIPEYVEAGSEAYVSLDLPSDANGVLNVYYRFKNSSKEYVDVAIGNSSIEKGHANVSISDLEIGSYEIHARYTGDDRYAGESAVIVNVHPPVVVPQSMAVGQDALVTINVPSKMGGTLTVYEYFEAEFDDSDYDVMIGKCDVSNGTASVSLSGLDVNNHTVKVEYKSGDYTFTNYYPVSVKENPQLSLELVDIYENETLSVSISASLNATGDMMLYLNGKTYQITLANGKSTLEIANLGVGTYDATLKFAGDEVFGPQEISKSFKVNPLVQPEIKAKNVNVIYSSNGKYSVTVYGRDGNVAGGVDVVFKILGKQVGKTKTSSKGVASYTVKNVPGTYKITASALGTSATKTLTVKHVVSLKSVTVKKSAKKLVLQATLSKVNGKYLKNKNVVFKFNGKTYKAKTNSKGVAKLTLKSSVLKKLKVGKKVTYQATYLKDTVKKSVKVKK